MKNGTRLRWTAAIVGLAALASVGQATYAASYLIYSSTSNAAGVPGSGQFFKTNLGATDGNASIITLDNISVPNVSATQSIRVTQVKFTLFERDGSPTSNFTAYYSNITADRTSTASPTIAVPPVQFGTTVLPAIASNGTALPVATQHTVTFGNGVNTLFTLSPSQINRTDIASPNNAVPRPPNSGTFGEFVIGFNLSDTSIDPRGSSPFRGVQLAKADPTYTNPEEIFKYLPGSGVTTFRPFAQTDPDWPAGLYIEVFGEVPEPGTLSLAAISGLLILARRPSRKGTIA